MNANASTAFDYLHEIDCRFSQEHELLTPAEQQSQQHLHFRVGDYNLLLNLTSSTEVISSIDYSLVPQTQPWLLGMASLRGKLLPLIDLGCYWFDQEPAYRLKSKRVIAVKVGAILIGLVVDHVFGVLNIIEMSKQESVPANWDDSLKNVIATVYSNQEINYGLCDLQKLIEEEKFTRMQRGE